jgi:two-component system, cell cycle response regulator
MPSEEPSRDLEARREQEGEASLDEPEEVTLRAIGSAVLRSPPRTMPRPLLLERRNQRETPMITARLIAPVRDRAALTVLNGADAGALRVLGNGESTLGRAKEATLSIDEPSISRGHARVVRDEAGGYVLEDLGSTNGTFVNGRRVSRVMLTSGDRIQLGRTLLLRFALVDEQEEALQRRLYETSTRDALTGLINRRCLLDRLGFEIRRASAEGRDTGMLMIDIDHFKKVNDTFGHLTGDHVLRELATSAGALIRVGDLFARYGGEEFVAMICRTTKEDLVGLAERLRFRFSEVRVAAGEGFVGTTVSVGVALWSECASLDCLDLVALADDRMYAAKRAGRDCVCFRSTTKPPPRSLRPG